MKLERFTALKIIFGLGLGGTLFAGYLTFFKAITGSCALGESCPYVLGLPACVYGFAMFTAMASVAAYAAFKKVAEGWPERVIQIIAVAGTLFAGWLSYQDLGPWLQSGGSYTLYLPSCVYGLVFYISILALSSVLVSRLKGADESGAPASSLEQPLPTEVPEESPAPQADAAPPEQIEPKTELPESLRQTDAEGEKDR